MISLPYSIFSWDQKTSQTRKSNTDLVTSSNTSRKGNATVLPPIFALPL